MSGSLTLAAGEIFTGGTSLTGFTGEVAITQTGTVTFSSGPPPAITGITITQDALASSLNYSGVFIQDVTIDTVSPNQVVTLTTADLPPGYTLPPGFTLPQNVIATTIAVTVQTNFGALTGTAAVLGQAGALVLAGDVRIDVFGSTIDAGAAVLSLGGQTTGSGLSESFIPVFSAACYAQGTRIATLGGDVPVERLVAGERVLSAFGGQVPVVWTGHRRVDCRRHPRPRDVWPVRVRAGAFAPGQPARELLLSPDHAVFTGGVLIPVRHLINGATIAQEETDSVTYWHVELPMHDVVLAEGLACESYLDTGNRAAFEGGGAIMMHADFARAVWQAQGCARLVVAGGELAAARARLLARAAALGHRRTAAPGLVALADGRRVAARRDGARHLFDLPAGTRSVRLVSRHARPDWTGAGATDHRRLGVAVAGLRLDGREVPASDRGAGWQDAEPGWQWTDGDAAVIAGPGVLEVVLAPVGLEYWVRPQDAPHSVAGARPGAHPEAGRG